MSQMSGSLTASAVGSHAADEVTVDSPVAVYSCSRLGRVANPPSFSLADWFRSARRRG
ncbi:hypothetical protein [Mycolicibacterium pulveris]|uniref:hypothetical protein n=1 Tax=Mycolicibacterium pulveris TaxID=36813 RepID=UPI0013D2C521|nr:hypothetical protein [Mycolicibacterium pulveris]